MRVVLTVHRGRKANADCVSDHLLRDICLKDLLNSSLHGYLK
jgi:hypothetical protein